MSHVHEVEESKQIGGVFVVRLKEHEDDRGRFMETYRRTWIPGAREMVQANRSESRAGTLRGMHYHLFQSDYWTLLSGSAVAGLFDFRASSPTFKASITLELTPDLGLYIPAGVAHGFFAVTDTTLGYLVDQVYDGSDEFGILYSDPEIGLDWPEGTPVLSDRDKRNPILVQIEEDNRPA